LLLASPLPVPVPAGQADDWRLLGTAPAGAGTRAWPASGGTGVLATGLAQGAWMLSQLAAAVPGLSVTTQPDQWQARASPLLLAEASVSGSGEPTPRSAGQDAADAEAAGRVLVDLLNTSAPLAASTCCSPHAPFNLLAAMAAWAGLGIDPSELNQDVLVIAAHPG
jgi:hypothetical protein